MVWCSIFKEIDDGRITVNLQFYGIMSPLLGAEKCAVIIGSLCVFHSQRINGKQPQLECSENAA